MLVMSSSGVAAENYKAPGFFAALAHYSYPGVDFFSSLAKIFSYFVNCLLREVSFGLLHLLLYKDMYSKILPVTSRV